METTSDDWFSPLDAHQGRPMTEPQISVVISALVKFRLEEVGLTITCEGTHTTIRCENPYNAVETSSLLLVAQSDWDSNQHTFKAYERKFNAGEITDLAAVEHTSCHDMIIAEQLRKAGLWVTVNAAGCRVGLLRGPVISRSLCSQARQEAK